MIVRAMFLFVFSALSMEKQIHEKEESFCLERSRLIRLDRDGEAVIVEVILGNSIILRCSYCDEEKNQEPRSWDFWNLVSEPKKLETGDRLTITPLNSLVIQNVSKQDAGFYFCRLPYDDSVESSFNFLVDGQAHLPDENLWKGDLTNWVNYSMRYLVPVNAEIAATEVSNIKFVVFSGWSIWSECEVCKNNPIQRRIARCRVKPTPNIEISSQVSPVAENILKTLVQTAAAFPCRGSLISDYLPNLTSLVRDIPDFVQELPCDPACPNKGATDQKQLILEEGGSAIVPCRGNNVGSKPRWEHNRRRINSATADGTAAVDRFGVLHFVGVTRDSKGRYTCFSSDDKRLFELKVVIRYYDNWGLGKEFRRHAIYFAIITSISFWTFSVISCGLYFFKKVKSRLIIIDQDFETEDQRPLLDNDSDSE